MFCCLCCAERRQLKRVLMPISPPPAHNVQSLTAGTLKVDRFSIEPLQEEGYFAGYASVFNVIDRQGDCMRPGAFKHTLEKWRRAAAFPKMLWQHKSDVPIGVWHHMAEDKRGLYMEGKLLLSVQKGREAYSLLKAGALRGLSIGYHVVEASRGREPRAQKPIRNLLAVDLQEVSIVTFAANESAYVTGFREGKEGELLASVRRLTHALRGT